MTNFFRVVRIALRRRFTFAAALVCSLCVAMLWGANLGLVKPIVEIVFSGKTPHAWVHGQVATAEKNIAALEAEVAEHQAALAKLTEHDKAARGHRAEIDSLRIRLAAERDALAAAQYYRPLVLKYLPNNSFQALAIAVGLLMAATVVKDGFLISNMLLVEKLSQTALFDLRKELFRRTLRLELARFGDDRTSNILSRFTNDANYVYAGLSVLLGKVILEPLKMIACLAGAAFICWRLLAVSLVFAPIAVFVVGRLTRSLKRANRRAMEEMSQLYNVISESFGGIQAVKAFGMERFERRRFHLGGKSYFFKSLRIVLYNALARSSSEVLGMAIICLAIMAGGYLVLNQQTHLLGIKIMDRPLSLGSLMAFYALLAGVSDPARKLSEVINYIQKASAAADRIYEMMDREPEIVDPAEPKALTTDRPEIVLTGVSFSYRPGQPVLRDIDLRIPFGETVAIVGPNGCGKSTVLRSLARLLKPTSGTILLDGADMQRSRTKEIARKLAILPQSPVAPAGITVRELVGYGRFPHQGLLRSASAEDREAVDWAIELTNLNDYRDREVDTLSGGERQRAWIAMALAQKTDVLLLDEPTTYLDIHYQIEVLSLVRELNQTHGITVGWVLHELNQAAAYSDRIIMLKAGKVACQGDPRVVMTPEAIRQVFGIECCVISHPLGNVPVCLPNSFCPLLANRRPPDEPLPMSAD